MQRQGRGEFVATLRPAAIPVVPCARSTILEPPCGTAWPIESLSGWEKRVIVYHLPMLAIAEGAAVQVLGGELRRFFIAEFEELDSDWAHAAYFVKSSAVWVVQGSVSDNTRDDEFVASADLVRLAAMAVLEVPLPSPRLSIRYFGLGQKARARVIGPFERTLLLNDHSVVTAEHGALERIALLADTWRSAGYDAEHPVFRALSTYGAVYTSLNAFPELRMMPTMVSLEGMFAADKAPRIADRMTAALTAIIGPSVDLAPVVKRLYDLRSDIIHGRSVDKQAAKALDDIGFITCRATLGLMERLIGQKTPPGRWREALGKLS